MFNKQFVKKLVVGDFTWQRFVRSLIFIYAFVNVYVFLRADSMIFLPQSSSYQDTKEIIKLTSTNKTKLSAIYLFNPSAKYTILYTHGNAEDLGDIRSILERLQSLNFSVFAYDYRGYGTSEGKPTEQYAYEDIDTAYNYLTQQLKISPSQIVVFGRSVGGGSAVDLAARKSVAGLIVESTFISAFRVVVPFPILPFDKFANLEKIKRVNCPILVMHGRADETIPFSHGEKLFAAAPSPKLSLWIDEATHNDFIWVAGEKYDKTLGAFIKLVAENQQRKK
ncbi:MULTISPECIES: alpha/beta hydrolase [Nostocales]|uniref:Alpha/beta hydrolase n=2 Tax=Nostocales TaxID=1161 RepID=A0A0C1REG4_9CYAN|nr:alpha/beta hydrolase [Tolypothrix bouteillei]KAF3886602.1 alpha/beta hydrolase [Tolypothrix bouteillei VB521301]